MAFSKIVIVATALASLVAAAPMNIPRDVTSIVTETAWTTVDVPVTLWVDESGKPIRTEVPPQAGNFAEKTSSPVLQSSALPSTTISVSVPTTPAAQAAPVVPTTTSAPVLVASQNVAPQSVQSHQPAYTPPAAPVAPSSSASYQAPSTPTNKPS